MPKIEIHQSSVAAVRRRIASRRLEKDLLKPKKTKREKVRLAIALEAEVDDLVDHLRKQRKKTSFGHTFKNNAFVRVDDGESEGVGIDQKDLERIIAPIALKLGWKCQFGRNCQANISPCALGKSEPIEGWLNRDRFRGATLEDVTNRIHHYDRYLVRATAAAVERVVEYVMERICQATAFDYPDTESFSIPLKEFHCFVRDPEHLWIDVRDIRLTWTQIAEAVTPALNDLGWKAKYSRYDDERDGMFVVVTPVAEP